MRCNVWNAWAAAMREVNAQARLAEKAKLLAQQVEQPKPHQLMSEAEHAKRIAQRKLAGDIDEYGDV